MPTANRVEKKIFAIEGFRVSIKQNGEAVLGNHQLPVQYETRTMSRNAFSVSDFRAKFQKQFPDSELDVLKCDGSKATGQTKLSTVRDSYLAED